MYHLKQPRPVWEMCLWQNLCKTILHLFLHVSQHFQSEMFSVALKARFVLSERDERETDHILLHLLYILRHFGNEMSGERR